MWNRLKDLYWNKISGYIEEQIFTLFIFLLFSTIAFAQKHQSNDDLPSSFDQMKLLRKLRTLLILRLIKKKECLNILKGEKNFLLLLNCLI